MSPLLCDNDDDDDDDEGSAMVCKGPQGMGKVWGVRFKVWVEVGILADPCGPLWILAVSVPADTPGICPGRYPGYLSGQIPWVSVPADTPGICLGRYPRYLSRQIPRVSVPANT